MNQPSELIDPACFDVRRIPCRVKHAQIFQRWAELPAGGYFILINDHDPVPLRYQFEAEFPGAFSWEYLVKGAEEFRVKIGKVCPGSSAGDGSPNSRTDLPAVPATAAENVQQIDTRGLEPPEPLIRILNTLTTLPDGVRLRAVTDRKPCHLFAASEKRGFRHVTTEQSDGSWVTVLDRA